MTASETKVFDWAQDYDNFETDSFASFIPDVTPGEAGGGADEQRHHPANPLFLGFADVDTQLDKLKRAADAAGLDALRAEMGTQADAYLKAKG